jgi:hypothetical protein
MVRTALAAVAERPVGRVFAALAARRGGEAVHRDGVVLTGTLTVTGQRCGVPLLDRPGSYAVVVRLSWGLFRTRRSGGHPPDVAGLALRVLDADGRGGARCRRRTTACWCRGGRSRAGTARRPGTGRPTAGCSTWPSGCCPARAA